MCAPMLLAQCAQVLHSSAGQTVQEERFEVQFVVLLYVVERSCDAKLLQHACAPCGMCRCKGAAYIV
jgi:hypothetical protein